MLFGYGEVGKYEEQESKIKGEDEELRFYTISLSSQTQFLSLGIVT